MRPRNSKGGFWKGPYTSRRFATVETVCVTGVTSHMQPRGDKFGSISEAIGYMRRVNEEDNMTMSRDRVHFTIPAEMALRSDRLRDVFEKAFGRRMPRVANNGVGLLVICRPSQFARFLIYREQMGVPNSFRALKAELVPADDVEEEKPIIDVSREPRRT